MPLFARLLTGDHIQVRDKLTFLTRFPGIMVFTQQLFYHHIRRRIGFFDKTLILSC